MIPYFILCGFFKSICQNPTYFIITLFSQKVLKWNGYAKGPCLVEASIAHSFSTFLSPDFGPAWHQGGGLKANSIVDVPEDRCIPAKYFIQLLVCIKMNKVRTAIIEPKSQLWPEKVTLQKHQMGLLLTICRVFYNQNQKGSTKGKRAFRIFFLS